MISTKLIPLVVTKDLGVTFQPIEYTNSTLVNGDAVTVKFITYTLTGGTVTTDFPAVYNNQVINILPLTAAEVNTLVLSTSQYLEVSKGTAIQGKRIWVQIRDSVLGVGKNPCDQRPIINELPEETTSTCCPLTVQGINGVGDIEPSSSKLVFGSLSGDINPNIVVTPEAVTVDLSIVDKAVPVPTTTPPILDGEVVDLVVGLGRVQSQINALDKRPTAKGVLPVGGATKMNATVITAGTMPLSVDNQDFYVAPSAGFYTLPNGTTVKLDSGEAVVLDKATGTYYTSRGLDNQLASDVPYSNTVSGLVSTDTQGAIDELASISAVKMNKTQGTVTGDKVLLSVGATGIENVESTVTKAILEGALVGYDVTEGSLETRLDSLENTTTVSTTALAGILTTAQETALATGYNKNTTTGEVWYKNTAGVVVKVEDKKLANIAVSTLDLTKTNTIQLVAGKDRVFVDYLGVAQRLNVNTSVDVSPVFFPQQVSSIPLSTPTRDASSTVYFDIDLPQVVRIDAKTTLIHNVASSSAFESYLQIFNVDTSNNSVSSLPNVGFGDDIMTSAGATSQPLQHFTYTTLPAGRYGAKYTTNLLSGDPITVGDQSYVAVTRLDY